MTKDEMAGWHYGLNGQEFEQAQGDGEGQGSLEWHSPWVRKGSDTTEQLLFRHDRRALAFTFKSVPLSKVTIKCISHLT